MTSIKHFPLQLERVFFTDIKVKREPVVPEPLQVGFSSQVKTVEKDLPEKLQVNLKTTSIESSPVNFDIELVGIFTRIDKNIIIGGDDLVEFMNERALPTLWPYLVNLVFQLTSQMGMRGIFIPTPANFEIIPIQKNTTSIKKKRVTVKSKREA
jgi:preprotein translocase subunit SecB